MTFPSTAPDASSTASTPPHLKMSKRPSFRRAGKEPARSQERFCFGDLTAALQSALGNTRLELDNTVLMPGGKVPLEQEVNQVGASEIVEARANEPVLVSSKLISRGSTTDKANAPLSKRAKNDGDRSRPENREVELRANTFNGNGSSGSRPFHWTYNHTKDFPVADDLDGMAHM